MLRTCLLTIGFLALSVPASANAPLDMGSPLPPKPQPVREKTKKQLRDGDDAHAGDDAKAKPAPKEKPAKDPADKQRTDK